MPDRNGSNSRYRKNRARVLAASRTCWICGHGDADATDHIKPWSKGGTDHVTNLAPVHHRACPTCGATCNLTKGAKLVAPTIRRSTSLRPVT